MEGANKNQNDQIRRQLKSTKGQMLCEDADEFHMYDLVEAEMFLRAGAVFKVRRDLGDIAAAIPPPPPPQHRTSPCTVTITPSSPAVVAVLRLYS